MDRARAGRRVARLVAVAVAIAVPCPAAEDIVLPAPAREGWHPVTFPKIRRRTVYTPVEVDQVQAVRAESDCAASALALPLDRIDVRATPRLRWRWKVERGLDVADERVKAGDDFAARVYVMFHFDGEHASLARRARHRIALLLFGTEIPGKAINYVRSSHEPRGATWDNPFTAESKMVSLGPAPGDAWTTEEVDVVQDYRRLVGEDPPALLGLAVMTDSDNSCQHAVAYFAAFTFLPAVDQGAGDDAARSRAAPMTSGGTGSQRPAPNR
jgi:hypothetical protein